MKIVPCKFTHLMKMKKVRIIVHDALHGICRKCSRIEKRR